MRLLAIPTVAAWIVPLSVSAQSTLDAARHRDECRLAVQIVTTGQPEAKPMWAFSKIRLCGAAAGQTIAGTLARLRHATDTARMDRYFALTREVYDGALFAAAFAIAGDRSASVPARIFALRSLIWSGNPGRLLSYTDLAGDVRGTTHCAGGFTTHVRLSAGTPLPKGYDEQVRILAASIAQDSTAPIEVRRAARCATFTAQSPWLKTWLQPRPDGPVPSRRPAQ
jgi:hypothetical protein